MDRENRINPQRAHAHGGDSGGGGTQLGTGMAPAKAKRNEIFSLGIKINTMS